PLPNSGRAVQAAADNGRISPSQPLTKKEREQAMMAYIEEYFKNFDYSVFEKYQGYVDPVRMCVGDPPEWVKPAFDGESVERTSVGSAEHPHPTLQEPREPIPALLY